MFFSQISSKTTNHTGKSKAKKIMPKTPIKNTSVKSSSKKLKSSKSVSKLVDKNSLLISNQNSNKDFVTPNIKSSRSRITEAIEKTDPKSNRSNRAITPRNKENKSSSKILFNSKPMMGFSNQPKIANGDLDFRIKPNLDISKLIALDHNINEDLFLMGKGDATLLSAFYDGREEIFGQSLLLEGGNRTISWIEKANVSIFNICQFNRI